MDRDISLDAIKLVACIFVCTLHTIGMFMSESSDFHLSYLLFYMSGIAVPLFFMVNGFLLAPKDGGIKYYYRKIFNIVKIVCVFTFIFDIPKLVRGDISILIPFKQACSSLFFQGGVFPVFWFFGSLIFIYALMPFLKKYIIPIRTRLYGLLLFLSVLQFIIYTCDIYTNYTYSFIFENVYIPQSFRLYSHLMYFLLGVCLRLYLTDNNMLKNVIGGGKSVLCYIIYILCAALICYLLYRNVGAIEYFQNSIICVLASLSFFLGLRSIVFSGYIGRTIVNLSSCSILVYTIHYPILSLLYMKTDLFVHTDFSFLVWAGLLLLWFFISYWVYQIQYVRSFLRI